VHFAHGHTLPATPWPVPWESPSWRRSLRSDWIIKPGKWARPCRQAGRLKKYGVVREVRGKGILRGVELVKNTQTMAPYPELGNALKRIAIDNGLIMRIDPSWFAVAPALIAGKAEIDEMCSLMNALSYRRWIRGSGHKSAA